MGRPRLISQTLLKGTQLFLEKPEWTQESFIVFEEICWELQMEGDLQKRPEDLRGSEDS